MMPSAIKPPALVLLASVLWFCASASLAQTLQLNGNDILRAQGMLGGGPSPTKAARQPFQSTVQTASGAAASDKETASIRSPSNAAISPAAHAALIQGYLYTEATACRLEIMVEASLFEAWLNGKANRSEPWSAKRRRTLEEEAAKRVASWASLATEQGDCQGRLAAVSMVRGRPGATLPLEEKDVLKPEEAWVGMTWEFITPPLTEDLTLTWKGWNLAGPEELPIKVFHGSGTQDELLPKKSGRMVWHAKGRIARPKPLAEVPAPVVGGRWTLPLATVLWLLAGALAWYWVIRSGKPLLPNGASLLTGWLLGLLLTYPLLHVEMGGGVRNAQVTDHGKAQQILVPLLRNVYQAFDRRDEEGIYDRLSLSVHGDLLRQLYLETITALSLDGREGARVTVKEFTANVESVAASDKGWKAKCQWTALGTVGHWGHQHTRINRYKAEVEVQPVNGAWKITGLEVSEARRL